MKYNNLHNLLRKAFPRGERSSKNLKNPSKPSTPLPAVVIVGD